MEQHHGMKQYQQDCLELGYSKGESWRGCIEDEMLWVHTTKDVDQHRIFVTMTSLHHASINTYY